MKEQGSYIYKYGQKNVGYAFVVGDLLHVGHLYLLKEAKKHCDFLIVGVYTDELTETYKRRPIIPFEERIELIQSLKQVDLVVVVHNRDCTPMLKKLTDDGWNINYVFHSDDWDPKTDQDMKKTMKFIEKIGGTLIQPKYNSAVKRTTTTVIKDILERVKNGENVIGKQ